MPQGSTFLDELSRLTASNFLGGVSQIGQAIAKSREEKAVTNLYNQFAAKREGLHTTDEQLSDFNKELSGKDVEDKGTKVIDAIANATLNLDKIYQQTNAYENLYRPYITAFATLGEDGARIANTLSRELDAKKDTLEKQGDIPIRELEYQNALYTKANNKMKLISGELNLENLKSDTETTNLLADMVDTEVGKQIFSFDVSTGKSSFNPRDMYLKLRKIYGDSPAFGKAWLLLEKHIYDHLQRYDSASMLRALKSGSGDNNNGEGLDNTVSTYSIMRSMTDKYGQLVNTPKYNYVRQAYIDQADIMDKKDSEIGSDPEVINAIQDSGIKKELSWLYNHFYDSTNDEYYWKYADVLKGLTGIKQIKFDENIAVQGLPVPLDMSKLITKDGGWWNPYEEQKHYSQIEQEEIEKKRAAEKSKQYIQNIQQSTNYLSFPKQ